MGVIKTISKFFEVKKKNYIGITVSLNGMVEIIQINPSTHEVVKYANSHVVYDARMREIEDFINFQETLENLFREIHIDPKDSDVIVCLPNVYFNFMNMPSELSNEEIETAIVSEAENNYVIRTTTPKVSFFKLLKQDGANPEQVRYAVSAIQENVVLKTQEILEEMGCNIVAIETSNSALIRGLVWAKYFKANVLTNVVLISPNSFCIFTLNGEDWNDYSEIPMPIQSYDDLEIYQNIINAINESMESNPSEAMLIISEVENVSAELLATKLNFNGEIGFIEKNKYSSYPVTKVNLNILPEYVNKITPEAVGVSVYNYIPNIYPLNFVTTSLTNQDKTVTIEFKGQILVVTNKLMQSITFAIVLSIFIIFAGVFFLLTYIINAQDKIVQKYNDEAASLESKLSNFAGSSKKVDIRLIQFDMLQNNRIKKLYYDSISIDKPHNLWLTKYYTDSNGAVLIKGEASSVSVVYEFFKNVKSMVLDSDILLTKLEFKDSDNVDSLYNNGQQLYVFELSNAKYSNTMTNLSLENNGQNNQNGVNVQNNSGQAEVKTPSSTTSSNIPKMEPISAPPKQMPTR